MRGVRSWCAALFVLSLLTGACSGAAERGPSPPGVGGRSSSPSARLSPAQTAQAPCPDAAEWCELAADEIPSPLRRPLQLPVLTASGTCPAQQSHPYENSQFGGYAMGRAPLQPLIAIDRPRDASAIKRGVLRFGRNADQPGWYRIKTLWFAWPSYQGPALIRGRQLNGSNPILFGESPSLTDPYLSAGPTVNGEEGFREWPGATWIRAPGCYGWQIDGLGFSYVIVFKAEFGA